MRFASLADWLAWQEQLHPRAVDLGLERVRQVAAALGLRPFPCPVVTVGGTNGKGSCVALLESLLAAGGYRVGAFTSPHLQRYNERIRIGGCEATDAALCAAFERIDTARGDLSLTFFEFNTLAALLLFQRAGLDAVLLEVGLGGRLDAVNIVDADVALLTSVGLDHCEWLGSTIEGIGGEKAGIFRAGRPAILGSAQMPKSVLVTERVPGASLRIPGRDFHGLRRDTGWDWSNDQLQLTGLPQPALTGRQQLANAAAVLAVLHELRHRLPLTAVQIAAGLRAVKLHGRFEVRGGSPEWIFDVAHNPDAAVELAANLAGRPCKGRTLAVVGILRDKDAAGIVAALAGSVAAWIVADLAGPRGTTAVELMQRGGIASAASWTTASSVAQACEQAVQLAASDDRIIVFGSFLSVGPALQWFEDGRL